MAIKVNNTTVLNDSRNLTGAGTYGLRGNFDNFHPTSIVNNTATATGNLDMEIPLHKKVLTGNFTFTGIQNNFAGNHATILIDRSASGHTIGFNSSIFSFPSTPSWSSHRWWQVSVIVGATGSYFCTAIGFDDPAAASSSLSNWTFHPSWDTTVAGYGTFSSPWSAVWVSFQHQTTNNRIAVVHGSGNFNSGSNQYTSYATYTGLSNITSVTAQYNVQSQNVSGGNTQSSGGYSYGPLPTNDGYSSGSYYTVPTSGSLFFGWQAVSQSSDTQSTQTSASFSGPTADFRIKIVDSVEGTLYATSDLGFSQLTCTSNYGNTPAI